MNRILVLCAALALTVGGMSCSSSLDDNEAVVYLSLTNYVYGPGAYTSVCLGTDVVIQTLTVSSEVKGDVTVSAAQDVVLTRWVVTPYRIDGGTVASPVYVRDLDVYVPAGSSTTLSNYDVYPATFYNDPPLLYLFPENGGFDPETGERAIEESLKVEVFGHTNSGQNVSLTFTLHIKFACQW